MNPNAMYVPPAWAHLVELANEGVGGYVWHATDEFFAEKDNLLRRHEAVFLPEAYTERGKLMDGWESMRRRTPGHDSAILRLGLPGLIQGLVVDTSHFRGNAPSEVSVEALELPGASRERLLESDGWRELLPRTRVAPNTRNELAVDSGGRVTHLRLHIHPDGGVARLRVFGAVSPEPGTFWRTSVLDLAAVENGGTIARASDQFYGPPANLLLPGRGVNMGDGWETARRRTPGSEWTVIRLGRAGVPERVELDTHFFKGNAPLAVRLEGLDARPLSPEALELALSTGDGFSPLLNHAPVEPHARHQLYPERRRAVTHVRVHMLPHGGINRLRLFGRPLDTDAERDQLRSLQGLDEAARYRLFLSLCASPTYARRLAEEGEFASVRALFQASQAALDALTEADWLDAFQGHPRLGSHAPAPSAEGAAARWSSGEQSGAASARAETLARLAALNATYLERHGFIFILFASGRSTGEMLAALEARLANPRAEELETAAGEQIKITQHRLEKWLLGR